MAEEQPVVADLEAMVQIADSGIVSKSIVENDHHKIILFCLAPGQELSEHTASVPAVIHVLRGKGTVNSVTPCMRPGRAITALAGRAKHAVVAEEEPSSCSPCSAPDQAWGTPAGALGRT
jgi:quercetin dioxygenase-like cupin family protein